MRKIIAILLIQGSAISFAADSVTISGQGQVAPGPCAHADSIVSVDGKFYEVERSRIRLQQGTSISFEGKVYPKISVCKKFPWLDITRHSDSTTRAASGQAQQIVRHEPDTVALTIDADDLARYAPTIGAIARATSVQRVHVQVKEKGDFSRFPVVLAQLAVEAPDVMEKVSVSLGNFKDPGFTWATAGKVYTYPSIQELRHALGLR